jgi:hypothetical protein
MVLEQQVAWWSGGARLTVLVDNVARHPRLELSGKCGKRSVLCVDDCQTADGHEGSHLNKAESRDGVCV